MAHTACWCGEQKQSPLFSYTLHDGKTIDFVQCLQCGVVTLTPQPTPEQLQHYYDSQYYGTGNSKFIGPIPKLIDYFQSARSRWVSREVARPGRILDVGCGNGGFLRQLQKQGYHVEGTELSADSCKRIPSQTGITVHEGDLSSLALPKNHYDAICLWHVFEHLPDPHQTCGRIHELLKDDGLLFVSVPNAQSLEARLFAQHWFHLDPPRHLFGFGPQSLILLLKQTGFEIESKHTFSMEQNIYGLIQSCLNALGLPRDHAYNTLKGLHQTKPLVRLLDMLGVAILVPPALTLGTWMSMLGRGSTLTLAARKIPSGQNRVIKKET